MSGTFNVVVAGLANLGDLRNLDDKVELNAVRAINSTAARTRTRSSEAIRRRVNFKARDLIGPKGRLSLDQAKRGKLEAVITGRQRPTSLAKFASPAGRTGVRVEVKPGSSQLLKRAFLIKLRAGSELTDTKFNMGLAIRLKKGEKIRNKLQMVQLKGNLYLLYTLSVDQVFRSVSQDVSPFAADALEAEFTRLMGLKP